MRRLHGVFLKPGWALFNNKQMNQLDGATELKPAQDHQSNMIVTVSSGEAMRKIRRVQRLRGVGAKQYVDLSGTIQAEMRL
jgi:hypothetical protein